MNQTVPSNNSVTPQAIKYHHHLFNNDDENLNSTSSQKSSVKRSLSQGEVYINKRTEIEKINNQQNKQIGLPKQLEEVTDKKRKMQNQQPNAQMQMMAYRKMLAEAGNSSDTGMINRMTEIAQYLHSNGLFNEVANELVEYILNIQRGNRLTYLYILDSILKNVQGYYVQLFQQRIGQIFHTAFSNAQNDDEKRTLIKLFNVWSMFFSPEVMNAISFSLNLQMHDQRLMKDSDRQKIADFKRQFLPNLLPQEVIQSGNFRTGSEVNYMHEQQMNEQRMRAAQNVRAPLSLTEDSNTTNTHYQSQGFGGQMGTSVGGDIRGQAAFTDMMAGTQGVSGMHGTSQQTTPAMQQALSKISTFDQKPSYPSQNSSFAYNTIGLGATAHAGQVTGGVAPNSQWGQVPPQSTPQQVKGSASIEQLFSQIAAGNPANAAIARPIQPHNQLSEAMRHIEQLSQTKQMAQNQQTVYSAAIGDETGISTPNFASNQSNQYQAGQSIQTIPTHSGYQNMQAPYGNGAQQYQGINMGPPQGVMPTAGYQNYVQYGQQQRHLYSQGSFNQPGAPYYQGASGGPYPQYMSQPGVYGSSNYQQEPSMGGAHFRGGAPGDREHHPNFQANQQSFALNKPIGFLPSILKSFYSFKATQQFQLGKDPRFAPVIQHLPSNVAQAALAAPSFKDQSLKEFNIFAIAEIYESVKFQCSVCGQRFIRNLTLKRHLDSHFQRNNEVLRKQRGNRTMGRPAFVSSVGDFVNAAKNRRAAIGGSGDQAEGAQGIGAGGNPNQQKGGLIDQKGALVNSAETIPYNSKEGFCYICKESFDVGFDEDEESYFFLNAKKIKLQISKEIQVQGGQQFKIVPVHSDCLKQIEMSRDLQEVSKTTSPPLQSSEKTESKPAVIYESYKSDAEDTQSQIDSSTKSKPTKSTSVEELERQTRGFTQTKRQFLGAQKQIVK